MRKTHDTSISLVFFLCIHTRYQSSSLPFRVGGFWIPQNLAGGFTSGWGKFKARYQSLPPTRSQPIRCMMPMFQHRLNIQIPPQRGFKTYIYIYINILYFDFSDPKWHLLRRYWIYIHGAPNKKSVPSNCGCPMLWRQALLPEFFCQIFQAYHLFFRSTPSDLPPKKSQSQN